MIIILLQITQINIRNTNKTSTELVSILYQVDQVQENCTGQTEEYFFFLPDCEVVLPGTVYSVAGRLESGSDNEKFAKKRLIVTAFNQVELEMYSAQYWRSSWNRLRSQIEVALLYPLFGLLEEKTAAVAAAVLIGRKQSMSTELEELFKTTGTLHLLAISGYNFSILVATAAGLLSRTSKRIQLGALFLGSIGFAAFVGDQPSVVRACISSLGSITASLALERQYSPRLWLCLSGLGMLVWRPLWVLEPGFQLSFMATASLLWGAQSSGRQTRLILGDLQERGPLPILSSYCTEFLEAIQIGARVFLATAPITLFHFHQLSILGVLVTASVFWLLPIITKHGFMTLILVAVFNPYDFLRPVAAGITVLLLELPIQVFLQILAFFADWQFLSWDSLTISLSQVLVWYICLALVQSLHSYYLIKQQSATLEI